MKFQQGIRVIVSLLCVAMALAVTVHLTQALPASGVVTTCDDAHFATALSSGGLVTFNCGGAATITATAKTIAINTTIDGSNNGNPLTLTAAGGVRLFQINSGAALTLSQLTIANLNFNPYPIYNQGTLYITGTNLINNASSPIANTSQSHLTIANSTFYSNTGSPVTNNGLLTVTHAYFASNTTSGCGNAIYNGNPGKVDITASQFVSNSSPLGGFPPIGGVVCNTSDGSISIAGSTFDSNRGAAGGIYLYSGSGSVLTITASSFYNNVGGGINDEAGNAIYISNTNFVSNSYLYGGGVYANGGAGIQVLSSTFQSNTGGAISINGASAPLVIADSQFLSNTASANPGGISAGLITVTHSSFINNQSTGNNFPGALLASMTAYITGSTFIGNRGPQAGAIDLATGTSTQYVDTIANSAIKGNTATNYDGGGIKASQSLNLIDSEISGNTTTGGVGSSGDGAGLSFSNFAGNVLTVTRSLFYNNVALASSGHGGGVYIASSGPATLINTTIYSNSAPTGGGLDFNNGSGVKLINVTLIGNKSTSTFAQGQLNNDGLNYAVSLVNTIIGNGSANDCSGNKVLSLGHNLVSDASCTITGTADLTHTAPLLGPFQNNGGPTNSLMPQQNSFAVNGGDNAACPATDQRGVARPIGSACDIGSIESPYLVRQQTAYLYLPIILR